MKRKDWMLVGVVVLVSAMLSFIVSNLFFGGGMKTNLKVEVVEAIGSEFPLPDSKYFNEKSINPTQEITIGDGTNQTPFQSQ